MWYDQQAAALTQQHKTEEQRALHERMDQKLREQFGISMDRLYDPEPYIKTDDGCSHYADKETGKQYSYNHFDNTWSVDEWSAEDESDHVTIYNDIAKFGQLASPHPSEFCCRCYVTNMGVCRMSDGKYLCNKCINNIRNIRSRTDSHSSEELSFMMQDMFDYWMDD